MTARRPRAGWLRSMIGSIFVQDEKRNMAGIFVAIDDQRGVVGFYSLSSFTLAITDLPPKHGKRLPRYDLIPAALIGRLACDERVRDEGISAHRSAPLCDCKVTVSVTAQTG